MVRHFRAEPSRSCARRLTGPRRAEPSASASTPDAPPGRRRARLSLLLPAFALLLGALSLFTAAPAQAQTTVWSATLTPKSLGTNLLGCDTGATATAHKCSTSATLNDNDFTYPDGGRNYRVHSLQLYTTPSSGTDLTFGLDTNNPSRLNALVLRVGGTSGSSFAFADATISASALTAIWTDTGLTWSADTQVQFELLVPASSDAALSGLTASSSTSATGTFTSLNIGTFSSTTTSYTATVANARTHVKLTPTKNHASASIAWRKGSTGSFTSVTSGSATAAIALDEGANAITVQVTAEDSSTQDYTVTVTRQAQQRSTVPTGLSVTAGNAQLTASWTAPAGVDVSRYEVQHKLTSAASWPTSDTDVSSGTSHTFTGLTNGSPYQVRVRTVETGESVASAWTAPVEGTPQAPPTVTLSVSPNPVPEGSNAEVRVTLSRALSASVRIPLTVTAGTAESGDYQAATGIGVVAGQLGGLVNFIAEQDDDADDETVTIALGTLPSPLTAGTTTSVEVTIRDDDEPVTATLSASPNPVLEGSSVTVTATLSSALSSNVTIPVTLTDDTAESGDHGTLTSITINSGATSGTGTIATNQDADEDNETFTVALGTLPSPLVAGAVSQVAITITDDDRLRLSVETSYPTPACGGTVTDTSVRPEYALVLTPAPAAATETQYRVVANTHGQWSQALSIETSGRTNFGQGTGTFAVLRAGNAGFRGFEFRLKDTPGITAQCTWTFDDGGTTPTTPTVSLSVSPSTVTEGSSVTVTARLSSSLSSNVTIPLTLSNGTAERSDYGSLSGITISSGSTTGTGTITTTDDSDTDNETFTVALGSLPSSVAAGSPSSVTVTISDDDGGTTQTTPTVSLSASPNPVAEGSSVTVTARLSSALSSSVTIPLTLTDGSAESEDYGSLSSITISSGATSGTGTITTAQDADEDDETFTVALGSLPSSVTAGSPRSVTLRIRDDDGGGTTPTRPTVSLTASPTSVDEGDAVTVTATLSAALSSNVRIPLTLSHGTAEDGDYGSLSNITISSGSTTGTGTISTSQDTDTDDETFTVALGNLPSSVTPGSPSSVRVTINDDDGGTSAPTTLTLNNDSAPAEGGDAVTLTATLNRPAPATGTTVTLTTSGTATRNTDYRLSSRTITIAGGETDGTATITVIDDAEDDDGETIVLDARSANPSLTAATLTLTIEDNDDIGGPVVTTPAVTLSASPNPVAEGSPVTVTATLSAALGSNVTIPLTLTAGTAEAGDYGTLESIAVNSGETTGTGIVTTNADADTDDETFTVALGSLPTSVTRGGRTSVEITITEATLPSITLSAMPETVEEGGAVTITASASEPVAANTEVKLVRDGPTSTAGEPDFRFEPPQMGVITISAGQSSGALRLTTTDDELVEDEESLTLNGLVGTRKVGAVTVTIEDNDEPEPEITYTLSGPEDPNLVEGKLYWITVTASAPVPETIEIEVKRDAAASTASDADFRLGSIRIVAGKDSGRRQLYVQADSDADGGSDGSTPETLVLFGQLGAHQFGELRFTLWDHTVPALPISGALLLGALLAWRGAVRARQRDAQQM